MIRVIKGTRDILPPESEIWNQVENIAKEILQLYGFSEIRTPIFENTELFTRGVGEDTDIVSKEILKTFLKYRVCRPVGCSELRGRMMEF